MDFFEQEERAQHQTRLLIWLFIAAVLAVLALNYLVVATCIQPFLKPLPHATHRFTFVFSIFWLIGEIVGHPINFLRWLWDPPLAAWISLGTLASVAIGTAYKSRLLSGGGPAVAELLGGRRIEPNTSDPDERKLRNVIEEMAIASGTAVPEIYALDNERGINSFAAGHAREDAAIGVTRGCLKLLTRDELQGVIAHEFSHILNGDARLNMRLMALAHGLYWPTALGRVLLYGTAQAPPSDDSIFDEDSRAPILPTAPIGILFIILGSISLPFVRLLKSAICREREWLADASAVQFTRNPAGIGGALIKIGGLYKRGRLDTPNAEVASHLYFADSGPESWFSFLSAHPPLTARIRAIDPQFNGEFPKIKSLAPNQYERDQAFERAVGGVMASERMSPHAMVAATGGMTADQIRQASFMRLGVPPEIKSAVRDPADASCVIYSLLLSDDESVRARQRQVMESSLDSATVDKISGMAVQVASLGSGYKLALAEFAVPALRQATPAEAALFCRTLQQLIECDGAIELFEYAVMKMVNRRLNLDSGRSDPASRYGRVQDVLPECELVLSALAHTGQEDEAQARVAFGKGAEFLDAPGATVQFVPRGDWDLAKVDSALNRLARCSPSTRRNILLACGKTVIADGRVAEREAELLRAVADSLDCPMPPFVEAVRSEELAHES